MLVLEPSRVEGDVVVEGEFKCFSCGSSFPIVDEVPDFVVKECLGLRNRVQRLLYNLYAPLYDRLEARLAESFGFSEEKLRREIVSRMDIGRGDTVLEVCIGTGGNVPYYREYTKGLIAGVDISKRMLWICKEKAESEGWRDLELFLGCAEYLPFKDRVFDRVLIGGGITYFSDPGRALREAARVAVRGGVIVVYEQVTLLEKLLGRDKPPLELLPPELKLEETAYLFGGRFYILKAVKER